MQRDCQPVNGIVFLCKCMKKLCEIMWKGELIMRYEDIVYKVREGFENADARAIFEHVAVQVNIEGEGRGAFYIEIANRNAIVEPYDYHDRDGLLTADAETLIAIAEGKMTFAEAIATEKMLAIGNREKIKLLSKIVFQKSVKKTSAKTASAKTAGTKTPAKKETKNKNG